MDWQDIKEESDWRAKAEIPTANIRSIRQNVWHPHFQVSVWKVALEKDPLELAPTNFGWEKDEASRSVLPVTISEGLALAPMDVILKVIRCGCATDQPCATARCMCVTAQMSCTVFCGCHGMECCNIWTKKFSANEEDVDSDSDDVDLCDD